TAWAADGGYVGSKICAGCHNQIYSSYIRTPMGRSLSIANGPDHLQSLPMPANVHSSSLNRDFRVFREGASFYQSESEPGVFNSVHKLEYVIGSGVNGYSYIVRRGNYLFQAPLSFYSRVDKWDLSPGYEFADYGFNRPIHAACITCHSGQPQPIAGRNG